MRFSPRAYFLSRKGKQAKSAPKSRVQRGYAQMELLARRVDELRCIPMLSALEKICDTETQSLIELPA